MKWFCGLERGLNKVTMWKERLLLPAGLCLSLVGSRRKLEPEVWINAIPSWRIAFPSCVTRLSNVKYINALIRQGTQRCHKAWWPPCVCLCAVGCHTKGGQLLGAIGVVKRTSHSRCRPGHCFLFILQFSTTQRHSLILFGDVFHFTPVLKVGLFMRLHCSCHGTSKAVSQQFAASTKHGEK